MSTVNTLPSGQGLYERRWERFIIRNQGSIFTVGTGLTGSTTRFCQMIDISQGGASFSVNTTIGLPSHYYLSILGALHRVGCAEIYRNDHRIGVQFIKPIDEAALRFVVRNEFFTGGPKQKKSINPQLYSTGI